MSDDGTRLPEPRAPALAGALPLPEPPTLRDGAAHVLLGGRRARAELDAAGALVLRTPAPLIVRMRLPAPVSDSVTDSPAGNAAAASTRMPRCFVPGAQPALIVDWEPSGDARRACSLELEHLHGHPLELRRVAGGVYCNGAGVHALIAFRSVPERLEVQRSHGCVRVVWNADEAVRMACIAASDAGELGESARALDDVDPLVRARAGAARRRAEEQLRVEVQPGGEPPLLDHARHALDSLRSGSGGAPLRVDVDAGAGELEAWLTLAALTMGDFAAARDTLRTFDPARLQTDAAAAAYLLALGEYFAWTGDAALTRAQLQTACPLIERLSTAPAADAAAATVFAAALPRLRDAAASVGAPTLLVRPRAASGSRWLDCVPGAAARDATTRAAAVAERSRATLAAAHAAAAVLTALVWVRQTLGAEPDAAQGRLRLSPCFDDAVAAVDVVALRVADATLRLRYGRTEQAHRFVVEQTAGGVPLRLVLEPVLDASPVARVEVDGQRAALEVRRRGEKSIFPLQIVLDHPRTVVIAENDGRT